MAILVETMHILMRGHGMGLDGYLLAPRRPRFSLGSDTYEGWCMLLPRNGTFCYEVEDEAAHRTRAVGEAGLRGEAHFGDVVISPPGSTLRRQMKTPTSFFFARFLTALEPPIGCSRLRDVDRLRADLALLESTQSASGEGHQRLDAEMVAAHVVDDVLITLLWERTRGDVREDVLVRKATACILECFTSPDLSLGDLARTLGVSSSLLSRRFRDVRGVTPGQYLRGVRLQKARELLTGTDFTLQTIAERCGYRSAFYLSRVFKATTGQSPSEYRSGSPSIR
ncbi:helix-turn-helix transcriptional regulator [Nonomuraea sp. NPDC049625]|uniref:helix-turn-helix transcriptional regulator n=1 Tax=Nonomuraea sp. NPDC049625 TaxID=3155775 RepID=UPI00342D38F6